MLLGSKERKGEQVKESILSITFPNLKFVILRVHNYTINIDPEFR